MKLKKMLFTAVIGLLVAAGVARAKDTLMMATTTSTDNTGLLDYLAPQFTKETGITLKWVATGTGKALRMGKNCDVDILLVHAPSAEKKFVANGYGIDRRQVMYNDFVIIGPKNDPVKVKGMGPTQGLKIIMEKKAVFLSRGDNSGTNKKEISLWKQAVNQVPEKEGWYVQTGQGMLATINMASEKNGYTITDRGTWIKYKSQKGDSNSLVIVIEGAPELFNQYSVITIDGNRCPKVQVGLAKKFSDWITSEKNQKLIGNFRLLGQPLFIPNADK